MMEFCARNSVSANIACISTNLECECTYTGLWQIAARGGRGREGEICCSQTVSVRYTNLLMPVLVITSIELFFVHHVIHILAQQYLVIVLASTTFNSCSLQSC